MTDLVRVEVDSPTVTFDDSLGKAQPLNPPNVAILLEYLSARFPCGTCTFPASPKDDFRLQNSPKTPRKARIRTVTHTTPLPPGGPAKDSPRPVLSYVHQSVATLHKKTQFIRTLFSNPAPELGSETDPPFRGLGERLHCVPSTYLFWTRYDDWRGHGCKQHP